MDTAHFRVGDRVKVRISVGEVRAGTVGTVQLVLSSMTHIYAVRFDDLPTPQFIAEPRLERLAVSPPTRTY